MHWWRIQWCPWELPMLRLYLSTSLYLTQSLWKTRSFYIPLTQTVFLCKPHALNLNWPLLACDSSPIHRDKLHRFSPPTPLAQKKLRQNCNFNFFITTSNKAFILHVDPVLSRIKVLMIIEVGLREPVSQCNVDCIQPCTLYTFSGWLERLEREQWREHKKYAVYYAIYTVLETLCRNEFVSVAYATLHSAHNFTTAWFHVPVRDFTRVERRKELQYWIAFAFL